MNVEIMAKNVWNSTKITYPLSFLILHIEKLKESQEMWFLRRNMKYKKCEENHIKEYHDQISEEQY